MTEIEILRARIAGHQEAYAGQAERIAKLEAIASQLRGENIYLRCIAEEYRAKLGRAEGLTK